MDLAGLSDKDDGYTTSSNMDGLYDAVEAPPTSVAPATGLAQPLERTKRPSELRKDFGLICLNLTKEEMEAIRPSYDMSKFDSRRTCPVQVLNDEITALNAYRVSVGKVAHKRKPDKDTAFENAWQLANSSIQELYEIKDGMLRLKAEHNQMLKKSENSLNKPVTPKVHHIRAELERQFHRYLSYEFSAALREIFPQLPARKYHEIMQALEDKFGKIFGVDVSRWDTDEHIQRSDEFQEQVEAILASNPVKVELMEKFTGKHGLGSAFAMKLIHILPELTVTEYTEVMSALTFTFGQTFGVDVRDWAAEY